VVIKKGKGKKNALTKSKNKQRPIEEDEIVEEEVN